VSSASPAEILVLQDPASAAADRLISAAEAGGHIALAGGSTPKAAYEAMAVSGADLTRATFWFGDERCVGPDHEDSNFKMVYEVLFDQLDYEPMVQRMRGELGPEEGARAYERELDEGLPGGRFDLILLGMGPDGHCASLFPNAPALDEGQRLATGVHQAGMEPLVPRITLTLSAINAAREVVFLAAGESKADAVVRAFGATPDTATPSSLVDPSDGALVVLLDEAAAALHPGRGAAGGREDRS
jgi:6-phosphogluconolactonase